jgi:hypothetical protein
MKRGQPLGLDELMIINPSSDPIGGYFLGDDGTLYQVQGLGQVMGTDEQSPGQFFLGEDGALYQLQQTDSDGPDHAVGTGGDDQMRLLLGDDGTLYRVSED